MIAQFIGSVVFTTFLFVWTGVYAIFFVIAGCFLPLRKRFALARAWAATLLTVLKWTCGLDYRVEGRENIPSGAHVAVWKHSSSWETIAMMVVFPPQVWVLKRELTWIPIIGWALALVHGIAIDRRSGNSAVNQVVEQGRARLDEGLWVVIFPEGTRVAPGMTKRFGVSGALLASHTGRLVVPVAHDAGFYWGRRALIKRPGSITVVIGKPIQAAGRDPRDINDEAQDWIERTIVRITASTAR